MGKKILISVCIMLMLITCFVVSTKVFKEPFIDKKTKEHIVNNVSLYLMNNENLKSDVPESMDIKLDKKSDIYLVTVKFENTSKKMNIFVSKDSTVIGTK